MTALFEIEEPEPIAWSHLVWTACVRRCGARALADPSQLANARCGPCLVSESSAVTTIQRLPAETPPPMAQVGSEKILAQNAAERAELILPEMVCESSGCEHSEPDPVTALWTLAIDLGWQAELRHSRGAVMGGAGKQLDVADLWSVRFRRGTWAGYAVRRGAAWQSVCITGAALPPFLALGVTDLREWLADPEGCGPRWVAQISERVRRQALYAKIVSCPGAPACVPQGPVKQVSVAGIPGVRAPLGTEHTHRASGAIVIKVSRKEAPHGQ